MMSLRVLVSIFESKESESPIIRWLSLVYMLVKKELKVRYKGSFFGYLWSMLNPLLYMIVLSFVFSHIMRFKTDNYTLFILAGILTWNLFSQGVVLSTASIVNNAALLKKVKVSATTFIAASVGSCLVNLVLAMVPFLIISFLESGKVALTIALVPLVLIPLTLFVFGIGLALGSLNVLYRDVSHSLEPILNMLFYASPIIYPPSVIPEKYSFLMQINPMAHYLEVMRNLLYQGILPDFSKISLLFLFALVSLLCGGFVFLKTKNNFIYSL